MTSLEICLFRFFAHFKIGLLVFVGFLFCFIFAIELCEFLIYFGYWPLISYVVCKHYFPFCRLPLFFVDGSLCCAELFSLIYSHLFIFGFVAFAFGINSRNHRTEKRPCEDTAKGNHLQVKERGLRRHQPCPHLDLRLVTSRTVCFCCFVITAHFRAFFLNATQQVPLTSHWPVPHDRLLRERLRKEFFYRGGWLLILQHC